MGIFFHMIKNILQESKECFILFFDFHVNLKKINAK